MNIQEYRESKINTNVTADIAERWQKRVVVRGLDKLGRAGGVAYLDSYGKSIGAKKCVKLAVHAESMEAHEFATVIWEKAFNLETGQTEVLTAYDHEDITVLVIPTSETPDPIIGLPAHLQPGKIATLQPQNLQEEPDFYLTDSNFVAQPKIDGHRLLAICALDDIYYQKRSLRIASMPSKQIHDTLFELVREVGMTVLDGELYWKDHLGLEHRTAAQAATANVRDGFPDVVPEAAYAIFDCLFYQDEDTTRAPFAYRASTLVGIASYLDYPEPVGIVDVLVPAVGQRSKEGLLRVQQDSGREGVVFRDIRTSYIAGKSNTAYRHKFLMEHTLKVTGLSPTDAEGRLFGAIETDLGSVGTGFTQHEQQEIKDAFDAGDLMIEVTSQGLTENGKLWHARFDKIAR